MLYAKWDRSSRREKLMMQEREVIIAGTKLLNRWEETESRRGWTRIEANGSSILIRGKVQHKATDAASVVGLLVGGCTNSLTLIFQMKKEAKLSIKVRIAALPLWEGGVIRVGGYIHSGNFRRITMLHSRPAWYVVTNPCWAGYGVFL